MSVTRSEALRRAESVWPYEGVPYSQQKLHEPDGYRQDCSGFVSMCWKLATSGPDTWGGYSTVTLVTSGLMKEIPVDQLQPGDAVGKCGPETGGDEGHVQLFSGWLNHDPADSHYYCYEQTGGGSGPHHRLVDWTAGYKAYRYVGIVDDAPAPVPVPSGPPAYTLKPGQVYGRYDGPAWQHGGYYPSERPAVESIQEALKRHGFDPGPVDGIYGPRTQNAVRAYQHSRGLVSDGLVGPITWKSLMA